MGRGQVTKSLVGHVREFELVGHVREFELYPTDSGKITEICLYLEESIR